MTTQTVNLYKGSYLDTLNIHSVSSDPYSSFDTSAPNYGYAIFNDAGTTKAKLFITEGDMNSWVGSDDMYDITLTNADGTSFDISSLSNDAANIVGTTNYDDGGSDMSGTFEIFSSFDLSYYIDVTFADSTPLITSGKYYSISPTDNGFDLQEWKLESGQWKTEGSPVAGYAPYADEAAMTAAFQSNNVTPQATVNMNTDMPANLYTMADLISVGIQPISNTASYGDDINTGYAVFTDQSGTTTILRYLKDGDGNFNLNETAPNPFLQMEVKVLQIQFLMTM